MRTRDTRKKNEKRRRKTTKRRTIKKVRSTRRGRTLAKNHRKRGGGNVVAYPVTIHNANGELINMNTFFGNNTRSQNQFMNLIRRTIQDEFDLKPKQFILNDPDDLLNYDEYARSIGFATANDIDERQDDSIIFAGLAFFTNANIHPKENYVMFKSSKDSKMIKYIIRFHCKIQDNGDFAHLFEDEESDYESEDESEDKSVVSDRESISSPELPPSPIPSPSAEKRAMKRKQGTPTPPTDSSDDEHISHRRTLKKPRQNISDIFEKMNL